MSRLADQSSHFNKFDDAEYREVHNYWSAHRCNFKAGRARDDFREENYETLACFRHGFSEQFITRSRTLVTGGERTRERESKMRGFSHMLTAHSERSPANVRRSRPPRLICTWLRSLAGDRRPDDDNHDDDDDDDNTTARFLRPSRTAASCVTASYKPTAVLTGKRARGPSAGVRARVSREVEAEKAKKEDATLAYATILRAGMRDATSAKVETRIYLPSRCITRVNSLQHNLPWK